jgi:NTP pyrophosphatase (non-canonical NTP hydrolase)
MDSHTQHDITYSELQKLISANAERYAKKHDVTIDKTFLILKLMEESGELAEALLVCDKQCRTRKLKDASEAHTDLENELADVLGTVLLMATTFDVDVIAALERKTLHKGRKYLNELTDK